MSRCFSHQLLHSTALNWSSSAQSHSPTFLTIGIKAGYLYSLKYIDANTWNAVWKFDGFDYAVWALHMMVYLGATKLWFSHSCTCQHSTSIDSIWRTCWKETSKVIIFSSQDRSIMPRVMTLDVFVWCFQKLSSSMQMALLKFWIKYEFLEFRRMNFVWVKRFFIHCCRNLNQKSVSLRTIVSMLQAPRESLDLWCFFLWKSLCWSQPSICIPVWKQRHCDIFKIILGEILFLLRETGSSAWGVEECVYWPAHSVMVIPWCSCGKFHHMKGTK